LYEAFEENKEIFSEIKNYFSNNKNISEVINAIFNKFGMGIKESFSKKNIDNNVNVNLLEVDNKNSQIGYVNNSNVNLFDEIFSSNSNANVYANSNTIINSIKNEDNIFSGNNNYNNENNKKDYNPIYDIFGNPNSAIIIEKKEDAKIPINENKDNFKKGGFGFIKKKNVQNSNEKPTQKNVNLLNDVNFNNNNNNNNNIINSDNNVLKEINEISSNLNNMDLISNNNNTNENKRENFSFIKKGKNKSNNNLNNLTNQSKF